MVYYCSMSGKLPLRQLVYRVFDLPPSMRPLVYDFGQLNNSTEERYIKHIVTGYVSSLYSYVYLNDSHVQMLCGALFIPYYDIVLYVR